MPPIRQVLLGTLLLIAAKAVAAAPPDAPPPLGLTANSRIYITLVPHGTEDDFGPRWIDGTSTVSSSLNFSLRTVRRNRLDFALSERDVLARGDQLQLRLASDAYAIAQLLSAGQFSEVDDSWIAVVGFASRVRLSYTNGPLEFSLSAKRKLGETSDVRARLSLGARF
jgi:hypothetical protein